jgi:hypothetical protein
VCYGPYSAAVLCVSSAYIYILFIYLFYQDVSIRSVYLFDIVQFSNATMSAIIDLQKDARITYGNKVIMYMDVWER